MSTHWIYIELLRCWYSGTHRWGRVTDGILKEAHPIILNRAHQHKKSARGSRQSCELSPWSTRAVWLSVMDASPSTSDTSYMSIDLDSSILHQVQKAIHRYDLWVCMPGAWFAEVNAVFIPIAQLHSVILSCLTGLQQPPKRSQRVRKKSPYLHPKPWNQPPPSLSLYQVHVWNYTYCISSSTCSGTPAQS